MDCKTYFVPVDFTECSYKAVQYAVLVARMFGDNVRLFHVIDVHDIPESDNPVAMSRMIDQLRKKAGLRMRSFCEMISEINRVRVCHTIKVGHVENTLMKEIDEVKPDVIFFGRDNTGSELIRRILPRLKIPAFVVPSSSEIHAPSKIALATDLRPVSPGARALLTDMLRESGQALSLIHVGQSRRNGRESGEEWFQHLISEWETETVFVADKSADPLNFLTDLTQSLCADLICAIRRKRSFFGALFNPGISTQLAVYATVPVLVLSEESCLATTDTIEPVSVRTVEEVAGI